MRSPGILGVRDSGLENPGLEFMKSERYCSALLCHMESGDYSSFIFTTVVYFGEQWLLQWLKNLCGE